MNLQTDEVVLNLSPAMFDLMVVKAAGDWQLDVLAMPFGSPSDKDSDGQWFTPHTRAYTDVLKEIPVMYYHGFTPDQKPEAAPEQIGVAKYDHTDASGHWYRVVLDKAQTLARRIWDAAKRGIARASSGSINHLVRIAESGEILSWPLAELSLIDADGKRQPANPQAVALPVMKAVYDRAGMTMPDLDPDRVGVDPDHVGVENQPGEPKPQEDGKGDERPVPQVAATNGTKLRGDFEMADELNEQVKQAVAAALQAERDAAAKAKEAADVEALRKENDAFKAKLAEMRRLPGGMPVQSEYAETAKYDHLSVADLALALEVQSNISASGKMRRPAMAAYKALAMKIARIENEKVTHDTQTYAQGALKAVMRSELTDDAIKAATDPAYSTLANAGDEWVGAGYSNQLWEAIRAPLSVVGRIPSVVIPDGWESETFPVEGADPTWYKVAQVTAADSTMKVPAATVTASQMGTAQTVMTVGKMGARAMYSGELTEDSIIAYAPQLRVQLEKSGQEMMEYVVIDGDTATSSNINDIGGTTYSGAATTLFLLTNGFRKSPLVTTTTQSRSAAGGFISEDFISTLKLLGANGIGASNPQQCAYIVDPNTWYAAAQLPEAKDANQTIFVVQDGFVRRAYGVEVIPSWQMHRMSSVRKANSAGKVDNDTTANNAYGAIVAVRFDQWKLAYKRRMTMETTRFANSDSWEVVALTRWGLGQRDTVASAETYYVGV